jgi:hypothetical protein
MSREELIANLSALQEKLNDHWGECLWIDATDLVALSKACEELNKSA